MHPSWNLQQDAGRSFQEAVTLATGQFPQYQKYIEAYHLRWEEMLAGAIFEVVEILQQF